VEKKTRAAQKQHGEENKRRAAEWQLWAAVTAQATNQNGWKDNVSALFALWHG